MGLFGNIAAVVAAPFVLTTVVMGAAPMVVLGLPAMATVVAISEIEDSLVK